MDSPQQALLNIFIKLEERYDFFNTLECVGIKYWHYIRTDVWNMVLEIEFGLVNDNNFLVPDRNRTSNMKDKMEEVITKNTLFTHKADILVINHQRRAYKNGYYKCLYTDEWLRDCNYSYYVFEEDYVGKHFTPAATKHLKYIKMPRDTRSPEEEKLYRKEVKQECLGLIRILETELNIRFSVQNIKFLSERLYSRICNRRRAYNYWKRIILRVKPKIIVMVVAYNFYRMIIVETAKELGIPTIELQHGIIGKYHIAYNYYRKQKLPAFPDYIFTFGMYDKETARFPIEEDHIIPVGSAELDMEVERYKELFKHKKKKKQIITYISSATPKLLENALQLSEMIDLNKYKIIIKLHPAEYNVWEQKYPDLVNNKNIRIEDGTKHDIYYYLAASDYIIGAGTTVLQEATVFDNSILVFKKEHYYFFEGAVEKGYAEYVLSAEDVKEYIERPKDISSGKPKDNPFFSSNSKQRIYKNLDILMNRKKN